MIETKDKKSEFDSELSEIRNYKVVKSNDLIQKSRYNLSTQEQKIILYLITKVKPEDTDLHLYEFKIKDFCEVCGIDTQNGKNYIMLKDTIKKMADKSNWITIKNENGDEVETLLRWIEKPYIDKKSGTIKIRLDRDMKPYLLELKQRFTVYNLYYTLAMKSKYSIRLYEILKSYEFQHRKLFDIDELKKLLSAENYTRYPDFQRYILDTSMREINDLSDLSITYEAIKDGKRYAKIQFSMRLKKDMDERLETWAKIDEVISPKQEPLRDKVRKMESPPPKAQEPTEPVIEDEPTQEPIIEVKAQSPTEKKRGFFSRIFSGGN